MAEHTELREGAIVRNPPGESEQAAKTLPARAKQELGENVGKWLMVTGEVGTLARASTLARARSHPRATLGMAAPW